MEGLTSSSGRGDGLGGDLAAGRDHWYVTRFRLTTPEYTKLTATARGHCTSTGRGSGDF